MEPHTSGPSVRDNAIFKTMWGIFGPSQDNQTWLGIQVTHVEVGVT